MNLLAVPAQLDGKKLLRFALTLLSLAALLLFMPMAARADDAQAAENETAE